MAENRSATFVVDSSFLLAYLLPDEESGYVQQFFDRFKTEKITLTAPFLLPFEVLNGLQTAILRKRIDLNLAKKLGQKFLMIPIELTDLDFTVALKVADTHKVTFYDASYLYLAKTYKVKLLTLDEKLKSLA